MNMGIFKEIIRNVTKKWLKGFTLWCNELNRDFTLFLFSIHLYFFSKKILTLLDSLVDGMNVCNYYSFLERKGNLFWRAWAVALLAIQFGFLKQRKKRERWIKKKKWGGGAEEGENKQLRVWILTCMIAAGRKKKKRHSMWFYHLLQDLVKMCQCQSI